jgi:predicted nucleotidyltransferase
MMEHPTPYAELNAVLGELVSSIRAALGATFVGAYLQGSFAVGDFDEHSDVDFIVAIRTDLADAQVAALQVVHGRVFDLECEWAKHLEGSYFPLDVLRHAERRGTPLWYLDHGSRSLVRSEHCNTVVVRQVVRDMGVTLAGPDPVTLVDAIPVDVLREEMRATMRDWGREILARPQQYANRFYQGYIVLSYARMLHDLVVGRPGSKRAGAEWAKATFGPAWGDLIDRAWDCRPNPAVSVRQPADPADFERTLAFVRLTMPP